MKKKTHKERLEIELRIAQERLAHDAFRLGVNAARRNKTATGEQLLDEEMK